MSKIAVVYWSGSGNTETMAEEIAKTCNADLYHASDFNAELMSGYEAIAFGCPSMGSEELEDGEFAPMFDSVKGKLSGKKIALFGSYDWGDGEWMRNWQEDCEGLGIRLVADGLICHLMPDIDGLAACRELGHKLASE
ncbi:MAG TPA: flavodoxin [Clostridiaceae bacterium]|jgi:flavodoxin I|nr:flavodoxin [Clostridiaceae bacterium]